MIGLVDYKTLHVVDRTIVQGNVGVQASVIALPPTLLQKHHLDPSNGHFIPPLPFTTTTTRETQFHFLMTSPYFTYNT